MSTLVKLISCLNYILVHIFTTTKLPTLDWYPYLPRVFIWIWCITQSSIYTFFSSIAWSKSCSLSAAISKGDEEMAWLILAWVSTIAGNLSLLGSAANFIVSEQARRAPNLGYTLTFWTHLKIGLPSIYSYSHYIGLTHKMIRVYLSPNWRILS